MAVQDRVPWRGKTAFGQLHSMEAGVRRELLADPGFSVSSLVVRRIPNGVCLEGVVRLYDQNTEVDSVARRVTGVKEVQNHLLVCKDHFGTQHLV